MSYMRLPTAPCARAHPSRMHTTHEHTPTFVQPRESSERAMSASTSIERPSSSPPAFPFRV